MQINFSQSTNFNDFLAKHEESDVYSWEETTPLRALVNVNTRFNVVNKF